MYCDSSEHQILPSSQGLVLMLLVLIFVCLMTSELKSLHSLLYCGYWSLCLVKYLVKIDISLNPETNKCASSAEVLFVYMEHSFNTLWGNLQLCLSPHFLLAKVLTVSQRWGCKALTGFSWACSHPTHMHGLLDSQKYFGTFQRLKILFLWFWLAYCLPQMLPTTSRSLIVRQLPLILHTPRKKAVSKGSQSDPNKDSFVPEVFQGTTR